MVALLAILPARRRASDRDRDRRPACRSAAGVRGRSRTGRHARCSTTRRRAASNNGDRRSGREGHSAAITAAAQAGPEAVQRHRNTAWMRTIDLHRPAADRGIAAARAMPIGTLIGLCERIIARPVPRSADLIGPLTDSKPTRGHEGIGSSPMRSPVLQLPGNQRSRARGSRSRWRIRRGYEPPGSALGCGHTAC